MLRITIPAYETMSVDAKKEYDAQVTSHGRITNMKQTLLHSVPSFKVLMEWYPLRDEVVKIVGEFVCNAYAYAISDDNDCLICSTFFRRLLKESGHDPDNLDYQPDSDSALLMEYARACTAKPTDVSDVLFERMRKRFSEEQIVLLTAFAGMMIATNLINNALNVPLDDYLIPYTKR